MSAAASLRFRFLPESCNSAAVLTSLPRNRVWPLKPLTGPETTEDGVQRKSKRSLRKSQSGMGGGCRSSINRSIHGMRRSRFLLPILTAVALVLAPAAARGQQRHCTAARLPDPLPMAMQLVDSVALAASLPPRSFAPTTFSLWYSATGQLTHVLALADTLVARGEATADSTARMRAELGTLIASAAFPQDAASAMSVRLSVARDSAGAVALTVSPSVFCSPVAQPHFHPPNERISVTREEIDEFQHATPALVTFVVDTTGHPLEVLIERSSGSRLIDSRVIESITESRFRPATVDGFTKLVPMRVNIMPPIPRPRVGP